MSATSTTSSRRTPKRPPSSSASGPTPGPAGTPTATPSSPRPPPPAPGSTPRKERKTDISSRNARRLELRDGADDHRRGRRTVARPRPDHPLVATGGPVRTRDQGGPPPRLGRQGRRRLAGGATRRDTGSVSIQRLVRGDRVRYRARVKSHG